MEKVNGDNILEAAMDFFIQTAIELTGDQEATYLQFSDDFAVRVSIEPMDVAEKYKS